MAMSAALSLASVQVVSNVPANFVLAVTNGGSTAVSVTSATLICTPLTGGASQGSINLGPNVSASVGGSSTLYFPCQMIFQTPRHPYAPAGTTNQYLVRADLLYSDGTASTTPMVSICPSSYQNTPPGANAITTAGQLRFDNGINSGQLLLASPA